MANAPFDDSEVALSYQALAEGWTGIRISPPDPVRSVELETFLRRGIYHGRDLRQLLIEPVSYASCALFLALFATWTTRDGIAAEWTELCKVVWEKESVWESRWDVPPYRQPIRTRIRGRIAEFLAALKSKRKRFYFARVATRRSAPQSGLDSHPATDHCRPSLSADDPERSAVQPISNPSIAVQTNTEPNVHLIFPGSSSSYVPPKDADVWRESEWIE